MKIRSIREADFDILYTLWLQSGLQLRSKDREKKEMVGMIKKNKSSCLVLIEQNKIIGSIFGTYNGRRAWIYHLAIHPTFQQKGYGTLLLKKVEQLLRKKGATRMNIAVDAENETVVPFYTLHGFSMVKNCMYMGKDL